MKKLRIYVDASIIGGCLDEEFAEESRAFVAMAQQGKLTLVVSDLLAAEIRRAPPDVIAVFESLLADSLEEVFGTDESMSLAEHYIKAGVLASSSFADAHHVAIATIAHADMIVSWNFKHLVHFDKIRGFNAVNLREGYGPIEIHSPKEVI